METEDKMEQAKKIIKMHACQSLDDAQIELVLRKYSTYLQTYPEDLIAVANNKDKLRTQSSAQFVWRYCTDPNRAPIKSEIKDLFDLFRIIRGDKIYITNNGEGVAFGDLNTQSENISSPIPSSYFYISSGFLFFLGFYYLSVVPSYAIASLSFSIILLIYPLVRFLMGGKDGLLPFALSILVEEYMKYWLRKKIDNQTKK